VAVDSISTAEKKVTLAAKDTTACGDTIAYDAVLIATGSM
jgi:NADH dehydrogenase FAD-containing subunit